MILQAPPEPVRRKSCYRLNQFLCPGDNQKVPGCQWADIEKREGGLIFKYLQRGDFAADDATEDAGWIVHGNLQ